MFLKGGAQNEGQFQAVGKNKEGGLILKCKDCERRFWFDPITGSEQTFSSGMMGDFLDFVAKKTKEEKKK